MEVLKFTIPREYANAPSRPSLHGEPVVVFVPGPPPPNSTAPQPTGTSETTESRESFETDIATLVRQQLDTWTPRLTQAGLKVELGPLVREQETRRIPYSSEYTLLVRQNDQLIEIVRFYVYHVGRRAATQSQFLQWLDRVLQLIIEGKRVNDLKKM